MPEPHTCHLLMSAAFVCIRFEHLGQAETQHHGVNIITTNITKLGGRR